VVSYAKAGTSVQSLVDAENDELKPVGHTGLVKNTADVMFDGLLTDAEAARDVFIRQTFKQALENLNLARR